MTSKGRLPLQQQWGSSPIPEIDKLEWKADLSFSRTIRAITFFIRSKSSRHCNSMAQKWASVKSESSAFDMEVKEIEEWWKTDRQKHFRRYVP